MRPTRPGAALGTPRLAAKKACIHRTTIGSTQTGTDHGFSASQVKMYGQRQFNHAELYMHDLARGPGA